MGEKEPRFDVHYYADSSVDIDFHFCREWGCGGTNPNHGFSFNGARDHIVHHYEKLADHWRTMTYEKWREDNGRLFEGGED